MTLNQLNSLDEQELDLCLYVVNVLHPVGMVGELPPSGLTWFKKGILEKKLTDVMDKLKPEAYSVYSSLLKKLGMPCELKMPENTSIDSSPPPVPPSTPESASAEKTL